MSICLESDSEIQKFNNNNSIDNDNMNISQIDSGQAKQDDVDYDDNINVQELVSSNHLISCFTTCSFILFLKYSGCL